jgi:hypothetical protein
MISFLDFIRRDRDAVPQVVSVANPLPVRLIAGALGGPSTAFRLATSAASNNARNIKPLPGSIFGVSALLTANNPAVMLKFFDTAGVPNPATDTPLYVFGLIAGGIARGVVQFTFPGGLDFPAAGIGLAMVRGPADFNNQPIGAGQVLALNIPFI